MTDLSKHVEPLRRESLPTSIYRQLCDLILHGSIAPGETITVASLAEAFGVSPMPVREALTKLSAAGVLTVLSGRSIGIPNLTQERLDDLRQVRGTIEPIATQWAIIRNEPGFVEELGGHLAILMECQAAKDTRKYIEANYDFHFSIYRRSGSLIMLSIIENLWLQVSPFLHMLNESETFTISNKHHKNVFDAVVNNDPVLGMESIKNDIDGAYDLLSQMIPQ